jgi:hypothetical protein
MAGHLLLQVLLSQVRWQTVACGLAYSALTVFDWARVAFRHPVKALGFCGLLEGVMTFSGTQRLGITALTMLIVINGIATGCNLVADRRQARSARIGNVRALDMLLSAVINSFQLQELHRRVEG